MKVIVPSPIDVNTMLAASTAVESEPVYNAGTSWALGDRVRYLDLVYESIQAANLNHTPGAVGSDTWWSVYGPINVWAMFQNDYQTATVASGSLEVELNIPDPFDSLYVGGVTANQVTLTIRDAPGGTILYQQTRSLSGSFAVDWFEYFFWDPTARRTQAFFFNLPPITFANVTLEFDSGSGQVAVSNMSIGRLRTLGSTEKGANTGIISYSRKEPNEFGVVRFVRRPSAKRLNARILVDNRFLNRVQRILYDLDAVPCVWVGSEQNALSEAMVFMGFYRNFSTAIEYDNFSLCTLELESLT